MRYALVTTTYNPDRAVDAIARYLPHAYSVLRAWEQGARTVVLIQGEDVAGWTLDDYVLPRLASGCHYGTEIAYDTALALTGEGSTV